MMPHARTSPAAPAHARWAACLLALALAATPADAGTIDWEQIERDGTALLSEYITIDTANPPGNEIAAARFLAERFRAEGIEPTVLESDPGRASIIARLRGTGARRPVVLLSHLDVVPADPEGWTHPPFGGVVAGGYVHGRGAIDCKGVGAIEAMALIALKRAAIPLSRDVIFLATADEETGGRRGAGWFAAEHLAALDGAEFLLNEGGEIRIDRDGRRSYQVAVAEKTPFWLRLTATGEGGHGSTPRAESAVTRLIRALGRIQDFRPPVRVVPEVEAYYRSLAPLQDGAKRARYQALGEALRDPAFRDQFLADPLDAALVRNTIAPTVLAGSTKTNVIPRTASADLDCRLLPGEDPDAFLGELQRVVGDDAVQFEVLLNFPPSSSSTDSALYRAISRVAAAERAPVVPSVLRGFTDSHYFREHGVVSYGFVPFALSEEDERSVHGVDERLSRENIREGTRRLVAILEALDR